METSPSANIVNEFSVRNRASASDHASVIKSIATRSSAAKNQTRPHWSSATSRCMVMVTSRGRAYSREPDVDTEFERSTSWQGGRRE